MQCVRALGCGLWIVDCGVCAMCVGCMCERVWTRRGVTGTGQGGEETRRGTHTAEAGMAVEVARVAWQGTVGSAGRKTRRQGWQRRGNGRHGRRQALGGGGQWIAQPRSASTRRPRAIATSDTARHTGQGVGRATTCPGMHLVQCHGVLCHVFERVPPGTVPVRDREALCGPLH